MSQSKVIALVGYIGAGKSTLFNRLTGAKQITDPAHGSTTREIARGVDLFEDAFLVLDTPGFGSEEDKLLHAACVLAAVSCQDIHQILLVIRYESYNIMKSSIKTLIKPFKRYRSAVSIYVSWFDKCDNPKEEETILRKNIENDFNINKVIFYEANASDKSIAAKIRQTLQNSKNLRIQLLDNEMFTCFDFLELNQQQQDILKKEIEQQQDLNIKKVQRPIFQFLKNLKADDPSYFQILEKLQQFAKEEGEKQMIAFEQDFKPDLQNWFGNEEFKQQYIVIEVKKHMKKQMEMVQKEIIGDIVKNSQTIQKSLQQCPHCDKIWVKSLAQLKMFSEKNAGKVSSQYFDKDSIYCNEVEGNYDARDVVMQNDVTLKYLNSQLQYKNDITPFTNQEQIINKLKEEIQNGYFKNVYQAHNVKNETHFFQLIEQKFGQNCFQIWLQILDQSYFSQFKEKLSELLQKATQQSQIKKIGCGSSFYWNQSILSRLYGQGKQLNPAYLENLFPVDFDPLKSYSKQKEEEMKKFIQEQTIKINNWIMEQNKQMKVIDRIQQKKGFCGIQ